MLKANNIAPTTLGFSSACTAEKGEHCLIKRLIQRKTLVGQSNVYGYLLRSVKRERQEKYYILYWHLNPGPGRSISYTLSLYL